MQQWTAAMQRIGNFSISHLSSEMQPSVKGRCTFEAFILYTKIILFFFTKQTKERFDHFNFKVVSEAVRLVRLFAQYLTSSVQNLPKLVQSFASYSLNQIMKLPKTLKLGHFAEVSPNLITLGS